MPDDADPQAIETQHDSLTFWATLTALGDFVGEPLALGVRAILAATLFAGLAALSGRPIRFDAGLAACAAAQGFWVLGLAVRVGLMIALRAAGGRDLRDPAFARRATIPPPLWVALRQLDVFALIGWSALAAGAWRRGQTNLVAALFLCGFLWFGESIVRIVFDLILGAGMRLTLIPG